MHSKQDEEKDTEHSSNKPKLVCAMRSFFFLLQCVLSTSHSVHIGDLSMHLNEVHLTQNTWKGAKLTKKVTILCDNVKTYTYASKGHQTALAQLTAANQRCISVLRYPHDTRQYVTVHKSMCISLCWVSTSIKTPWAPKGGWGCGNPQTVNLRVNRITRLILLITSPSKKIYVLTRALINTTQTPEDEQNIVSDSTAVVV